MQLTSRRAFLRTAVGASTAGMLVNPLGLFSLDCFAAAAIPGGPYLKSFSNQEFWFSRLSEPFAGDTKGLPDLNSPESQLSTRLGLAGGFATGFFSSFSFLGQYRAQKPESYADLFNDCLSLEDSPKRPALVGDLLEFHRKTADLKAIETSSDAPRAPGLPSNRDKTSRESGLPINGRELADSVVPSVNTKPLSGLADDVILTSIQGARWSPGERRQAALQPLLNGLGAIKSWPEASAQAQAELDGQFSSVNSSFENRIEAVDTVRLSQYQAGVLKLDWLDLARLTSSFQAGMLNGRLAALGQTGLLEAAKSLKNGVGDGTPASRVNKGLLSCRRASQFMDFFGQFPFGKFGMDAAVFRPAVRLQLHCFAETGAGPAAETRRLQVTTPFLPYEMPSAATDGQYNALDKTNVSVAQMVRDNLANLAESHYQFPTTTIALVDGSFEACSTMHRHAARLLRAAPLTASSRLKAVAIIPEVTSPWTFSGIASALCNTYLGALQSDRLATPQSRASFRTSVDHAIDALLLSSVAQAGTGKDVATGSGTGAALLQYASGYRTARVFADLVTDSDAMESGARLVYASLRTAFPERFDELPAGKRLSAEQISAQVLVVASDIKRELVELRLRVAALEKELAQYKEFIAQLTDLITTLGQNTAGINDVESLRRFKQMSDVLIEKMQSGLNESQRMALKSVQGLINSFVNVGISVDVNVRAQINAQVQGNAGSFNTNKG
ncbi:MAG TPA: hypothetical protein VGP63_11200 [Planctomycetaceae bacterium]|jgi:hypothetical protein|nr:hypothetical protein [Planctomycetaceae bacterium]